MRKRFGKKEYLRDIYKVGNKTMRIGNKEFSNNHTYVMGILNVTPDSFSDGGRFNDVAKAIDRVAQMIEEGAELIDVGGESTRPGFEPVGVEEEIERTAPVIEAICQRFEVPVSIDTYKSKTAEAAVLSGASMINDVWGFKKDKDMAKVAAQYDVACCLMHNREEAVYSNFIKDMEKDLIKSVEIALNAGVKKDKIILDPGVGFAKNYEQNLLAIKHVGELRRLGYPVLLATSRKSVIGQALDVEKDQRVEGTISTTVFGALCGCNFVRVHDIKENVRAIKMLEAVLKA